MERVPAKFNDRFMKSIMEGSKCASGVASLFARWQDATLYVGHRCLASH